MRTNEWLNELVLFLVRSFLFQFSSIIFCSLLPIFEAQFVSMTVFDGFWLIGWQSKNCRRLFGSTHFIGQNGSSFCFLRHFIWFFSFNFESEISWSILHKKKQVQSNWQKHNQTFLLSIPFVKCTFAQAETGTKTEQAAARTMDLRWRVYCFCVPTLIFVWQQWMRLASGRGSGRAIGEKKPKQLPSIFEQMLWISTAKRVSGQERERERGR